MARRSISINSIKKINLLATIVLILFALYGLCGCTQKSTKLTVEEAQALASIANVTEGDFQDISAEALTKDRSAKFPAVSKIASTESGLYGFICQPIAYNGPITLALVIDGKSGLSLGMQILKQEETEQYVRDMENSWFTDRFTGKNAAEYLRLARLEAKSEQDIVCITGATVTTEGVINGVNAAFGLFSEYVWGKEAPAVPYMVRFTPGETEDKRETGCLTIRASGMVLGEVTLEEIKELPSVKRTLTIHSSTGETQHSFRGTLLSNVLDLLDPTLKDQYQWVRTVGVDDYMSNIAMEEVRKENSVYLMYEDNGEPLSTKDGEPGAMRVVVLDDLFGQRFTNYLLEIVLGNEADL